MVCKVIGFSNGYQTKAVKVAESVDVVRNGADGSRGFAAGDEPAGKADEVGAGVERTLKYLVCCNRRNNWKPDQFTYGSLRTFQTFWIPESLDYLF